METGVHSYTFINILIINLRLKTSHACMTTAGICAPEEGKEEESLELYETLQTH
jgi:hypothetical protein